MFSSSQGSARPIATRGPSITRMSSGAIGSRTNTYGAVRAADRAKRLGMISLAVWAVLCVLVVNAYVVLIGWAISSASDIPATTYSGPIPTTMRGRWAAPIGRPRTAAPFTDGLQHGGWRIRSAPSHSDWWRSRQRCSPTA